MGPKPIAQGRRMRLERTSLSTEWTYGLRQHIHYLDSMLSDGRDGQRRGERERKMTRVDSLWPEVWIFMSGGVGMG